MTRNELAWAIRRKIAHRAGKKVNKVSWKYCYGVAEQRMQAPTAQGKKIFEPDGYYEDHPCTCKKSCGLFCKGQCGCDACRTCYSDFLSGE